MRNKLEDLLEECLARVEAGESVEECLSRYPQEAQQLEPLLRTALRVKEGLAIGLPRSREVYHLLRIQERWAERRAPTRFRGVMAGLMRPWATAAATLVLLMALLGGATAAAAGSLPGEPLYALKDARERVELALARSTTSRMELHARLVQSRIREMVLLSRQGRVQGAERALARLKGHLQALSALVESSGRGSPTTTPPSDTRTRNRLQEILRRQQTQEEAALRRALEQAPPKAQPFLQEALRTLQQEQSKIRQILQGSRPGAPQAP